MDKPKSIVRADTRCGAVMDITFNRNVLEEWWIQRFDYLSRIDSVEIKFESPKHEEDFYSAFECEIGQELEGAGKLGELYLEFENYCDQQLSYIYQDYSVGDKVLPKVVWVNIYFNKHYVDDDDIESFRELAPGHFCIDVSDRK